MELTTVNTNVCNPDNCPLKERCPVGPTPGITCQIKDNYLQIIHEDIFSMFPKMKEDPSFNIIQNYMLVPLFEQLLYVKMAYSVYNGTFMGKGVNPLLKEMRQIIESLIKVLSMIEKPGNKKKDIKKIEALGGNTSYYDMLFTDGVASVETPVGLQNNN